MTSVEEPVAKKARSLRSIELDLSQFPEWVGRASDNRLLEVFAIGVKVSDLITINITENPEFIKNILDENLQPVHDEVRRMSGTLLVTSGEVKNGVKTSLNDMKSDALKLQRELVNNVQDVANKVPSLYLLNTKIDSVVAELKPRIVDVLTPMVTRCENNLEQLVAKFQKPTSKGALGEATVESILRDHFHEYTIANVTSKGGLGDIHITTQSGQKYLVEVKDREHRVPADEIRKFEKNVRENKDFKIGILFSLSSGIAVRTFHGRFMVKFEDEQYYIYVPNAQNDKDLIVWIVMLADQLAGLNQGLTDSQTQLVTELLQEFQQSMETSKNCKTHLNALKRAADELEKNMNPLLKIIDQAKRKLNKVLHKV